MMASVARTYWATAVESMGIQLEMPSLDISTALVLIGLLPTAPPPILLFAMLFSRFFLALSSSRCEPAGHLVDGNTLYCSLAVR